MGIGLQIALPLFVTFAVALIIAIVRKFFKPEMFIACAILLALAVTSTVFNFQSSDSEELSEEYAISLILAENYMVEGDLDEAAVILRDLNNLSPDDEKINLALARCLALKKEYKSAEYIYKQIDAASKEEKNSISLLATEGSYNNDAMISYLENMGYDYTKYGFEKSSANAQKASYETTKDLILRVLDDNLDEYEDTYSETIIDAVDYAVDINKIFSSYISDESLDEETLVELTSDLADSCKQNLSVAKNPHIRITLVKGFVVLGQFDKIANFADKNTSIQEIMILTELYINDIIKQDDFSNHYLGLYTNRYKKILEDCEKTLKNLKGDIANEKYDYYTKKLREYKKQMQDPVLMALRNDLLEKLSESDYVLQSEAYLTLSKIENFSGNTDLADDYIANALGTASNSDDEQYRTPMTNLAGIVQGTADSEDIKKVAEYVEKAVEHSLPLNITTSEILEKAEENKQNQNNQDFNNTGDSYNDYYDDPDDDFGGFGDYDDPDDDFGGFGDYDNPDDDFGGFGDYDDPDDDFGGFGDYDDSDDDFGDQNESQSGENGTENNGEGNTKPKPFVDHFESTVNESRAVINIGVIDKDNFSEIKAKIQVQSDKWVTVEELKEHLLVYDCGSEITDFTLEKVEFDKSRIILLCDVSGSMSDSEDELENAIRTFAQKMSANEEVSVVAFNDRIEFVENFSTNPNTVAGYADKIYTGGGTALYESLKSLDQYFTNDIRCNNIIIAMTDGVDGYSAGEAEMHNSIGAMAAMKGLTVYTVGLGDGVDTEYLEMIADCGNGSFLYVESDEKLEEFYDFIHGQLSNQYILTYKAKNQTRNNRKLEISVEDELGRAEKMYYLIDREYSDESKDSYNPYVVEDLNISIFGLQTKFLYKSKADQTIKLKGEGFDKGDDVSISMVGNVKYNLQVNYVDEKTYEIIIPADVSVGTYDLEISIADKSISLKKELNIAIQGTKKIFTFGSYNFTALNSQKNFNGDIILSGNVTMNDWLKFKGDIVISAGYENSDRITVTDDFGAYISYSSNTAEGLAEFLAKEGIPLPFGKLGTFTLYNDKYTATDYETFRVEEIRYFEVLNLSLICFKDFNLSIYPDMMKIQNFSFDLSLPFQEQLLKNSVIDLEKQFKINSEVLVNATQIGLIADVEYGDLGEDQEFCLVSIPLNVSNVSVNIDTLKNDYKLGAGVGFKSLGKLEGFNFGFEVVGGKLDAIELQSETEGIVVTSAPVPVSMRDFGFRLDNLKELKNLEDILKLQITIDFAVDVASLNAHLPDIAKLIDDEKEVAIMSLDNCKLSLRLEEFRVAFSSDIVLCTVLDIGKCNVQIGHFDYTNELLGFYKEEEVGFQVDLQLGSKWETTNLKLDLTGRAELTLGNPYSGLWLDGDVDFEVGWWIFSTDFDVAGDVVIGIYKNSSGNLQLSVIVRGTNSKGKYSGFQIQITKATGFDVYKY